MSTHRHLRILDCASEDDFMATAIKVAFATGDMKTVDQHFGAAESFVVYGIDPEQTRLIEAAQFDKAGMDGNEGKLAGKIAALEGCVAVYANAMGASAVNQLKAKGIQPVKVSAGAAIGDLLGSLQDEWRHGPSAWLARALERIRPQNMDRFALMDAEGWDES